MMLTLALCAPTGLFFAWVLICEFSDWRRAGTPSRRLKWARKMPAHRLATEWAVTTAESIVHTAWLKLNRP